MLFLLTFLSFSIAPPEPRSLYVSEGGEGTYEQIALMIIRQKLTKSTSMPRRFSSVDESTVLDYLTPHDVEKVLCGVVERRKSATEEREESQR
jgi:hypothetical protein